MAKYLVWVAKMQQLSLFQEQATDWTLDDWQTPNKEAELIARLILPTEQIILDAGAGKGQITKFIRMTAENS